MDKVKERLNRARQAWTSLEEVMRISVPSAIERDAAIQRFAFTFEATWKAARAALVELEGIEAGSPKGVIRSCREVGWLSEEEAMQALEMADDRNLTIHTYNERLASDIYSRIKQYVDLLRVWMERIQKQSDEKAK